jgi:probable HAF family extracellular repeat protein
MTILAAIAAGPGLLAAASSADAAAYTFTTIDAPGADLTRAFGINNAGQIVGSIENPSPGPPQGFVYNTGLFTPLNVPGASETDVRGINNGGQIVGFFQDIAGYHGFLDVGGSFSRIDVPGAVRTNALGINNAGQIVGSFGNSVAPIGDHAFLYSGGSFTQLDVPGRDHTNAYGINDAGQIVGTFGGTGEHGFLYTGGSFTQLDAPGVAATLAFGINDAGDIVGTLEEDSSSDGFLYRNGAFITLDVPGAAATSAFGINDVGQIVGVFETFDQLGRSNFHGFLATPTSEIPEPSGLALLGVSLIGLGILRRRDRIVLLRRSNPDQGWTIRYQRSDHGLFTSVPTNYAALSRTRSNRNSCNSRTFGLRC